MEKENFEITKRAEWARSCRSNTDQKGAWHWDDTRKIANIRIFGEGGPERITISSIEQIETLRAVLDQAEKRMGQ